MASMLAPFYTWLKSCDFINVFSVFSIINSFKNTVKLNVSIVEELDYKTQQVHFSNLWKIATEDKITKVQPH